MLVMEFYPPRAFPWPMSQTQSHISRICQEIHDMKWSKNPKSIIKDSRSTLMDEGERADPNYTQEQDNSSSAKGGNNDGDGFGDTYSSHSTQYHHEPSNPNNPSHHAPSLPCLSQVPSGSTPRPPAILPPSPTSRIVTLSPSSPS